MGQPFSFCDRLTLGSYSGTFFPPTTWVSHVYRMAGLCTSYPQLTQTGIRVVDAPRVCAAPSRWGASQWSQCGCWEARSCTSGRWLRTHKSHTRAHTESEKREKHTSKVLYNSHMIPHNTCMILQKKNTVTNVEKFVLQTWQTGSYVRTNRTEGSDKRW